MEQGNGKSTERRRVVQRNGIIFPQGEVCRVPAIIEEGLVRLCDYLPDGQRVVLGFAFPGELIGMDVYSPTVTTEAATSVLLRAWPGGNAGFETAEARALTDALRRLNASVAVRARRQLEARVAAFLVNLVDRDNDSVWDLPVSRSDLADHLVLSVHTVSRVISTLQRFGIVARARGKKLTILDLDQLRNVAGEGMPPPRDAVFALQSEMSH